MTERENLIRAARRQGPDHVPHHLNLCASLVEAFRDRTGQDDYEEYFQTPVRGVFIRPTRHCIDRGAYFKNAGDLTIDEWGIGYIRSSVAHFTRMVHPLENADVAQIRAYPLPDVLEPYRWEGVEAQVQEYHRRGLAAFTGIHAYRGGDVAAYIDLFERAWYLRGQENFLVDLMTDEDVAAALLDKVLEYDIALARRWAKTGVDMICLGDDVGSQKGLILSPATWKRWIKPRLSAIIRAAKAENPGALIFYHSCGDVYEIIPDLIECGVDILNPVQPECMDAAKISREYGGSISFWGVLGTQRIMPFGTAEEVRSECRRIIGNVGQNGGLIFSPTHILEPEVPWENIEAFIQAAAAFGKY